MGEKPQGYDLAGQVIGCAMKVHGALGSGFLESVYRNALAVELRNRGFAVTAEHGISVYYNGETVGTFVADLLVNGVLIVELKAVQALAKVHEVQLVNYLTDTGLDDGLILNFGTASLEFRRKFRRAKAEDISL